MSVVSDSAKTAVFERLEAMLADLGFQIEAQDRSRPWGGFFVINEAQAPAFIAQYFPHLSIDDFRGFDKLSPKILVVAPQTRLSWQYHFRRAEIWKLIEGTAGVVISDTDEETTLQTLAIGDIVNLKQGERHRLVGLDDWGVVAEIWQHTDPQHPSDEEDIVRVQDDFGR